MGIQPPAPSLNSADKRLLRLLGELVLYRSGNNIKEEDVPLTDGEATELLHLLDELVASKQFAHKIHLAQELARQSEPDRDIYLSGRKDAGKSRAMASKQWADFLSRLGRKQPWTPWRLSEQLPEVDFYRMERRLFESLGVDPQVATLAMEIVSMETREAMQIASGNKPMVMFIINAIIMPMRSILFEKNTDGSWALSRAGVASLWSIIANTSVIFTTRDWSVAGIYSTYAATLAAVKSN